MNTRVVAATFALVGTLCSTSGASAGLVEDLTLGYTPALSADGQKLYITTEIFDPAAASRLELDLALITEMPAPLPALPTSAVYDTPIVSASGRYIAFTTPVGLVPGDTNGDYDVYLLDTVTSALSRESIGHSGQQGNPSFEGARDSSLSADGRYVVFLSWAPNLVPSDTNGGDADIFVRDRCISEGVAVPACTPTTELVSLGPGGIQSTRACALRNPYAGGPSISADGRWVTFSCWAPLDVAPAFAPGHTCVDYFDIGCTGAYVRDRCVSNGTPVPACLPATELVSLLPDDSFPNGAALYPVISGDGARVFYSSVASDIVPEDPGPTSYDVFMFDRNTATTTRLTTPPPYSQLSGQELTVSADGFHAAWATNGLVSYWADCGGIAPTCGDSATELGCEDCDDGAFVDGDGCDSNCMFTGCNNGVVTAGETCDDGNTVDGDGCDSNCTPTSCGNDIRTSGEACDDGDGDSGDGCSATCAVEPGELTPAGKGKADCELELMPYYQPVKVQGIPKSVVVCQDDDPSCDFGPTLGDKHCYFKVAFCANVADPRLACTPIDVARVEFSKPNFSSSVLSPVDFFNAQWIYQNFTGLGAELTQVCTKGTIGAPCGLNSQCGAGGKCSKLLFNFASPLTTPNACTDFGRVAVPLKEPVPGVLKQGSLTLKYKAVASNDPVTGKPRNKDSDSFKLICLPPP